jgi:hypothetical protein
VAFTQVTITGSFIRPDGQPAYGTVTATLSEPIANSGQQIDPTPVTGVLVAGQLKDDTTELPFVLEANDDPGTTPAGSSYRFVIELDSAPVDEFAAIVPHTAPGATIDLEALR